MRRKYEVGYNKEWALKVGRMEFLKQMNAAFPEHDHLPFADQYLPEKKKPVATNEPAK